MTDAVRAQIRGLAGRDALQAEIMATALLSMWRPDWPGDAEALDELGTIMLTNLGTRPDVDALALLVAVRAMATPPFDAAADASVTALAALGVPEPAWSRSVTRPALVETWISTDELDDQSNIAATFAYDGQTPHVIVFLTDANFGGLIRQAFIGANPGQVRDQWTRASAVPIRPLSEQELADRLARGIEAFDETLDPPIDAEARQLMPLLRARLRLLPPPRPLGSLPVRADGPVSAPAKPSPAAPI